MSSQINTSCFIMPKIPYKYHQNSRAEYNTFQYNWITCASPRFTREIKKNKNQISNNGCDVAKLENLQLYLWQLNTADTKDLPKIPETFTTSNAWQTPHASDQSDLRVTSAVVEKNTKNIDAKLCWVRKSKDAASMHASIMINHKESLGTTHSIKLPLQTTRNTLKHIRNQLSIMVSHEILVNRLDTIKMFHCYKRYQY